MDDGGGGLGVLIFQLIVLVVIYASLWKIFTKAGEPGWAAIVPIYNAVVMLKIAGKPWWWLFLFLIPLVGMIMGVLFTIALARSFGKGIGFAIGMLIVPFIMFPLLAFGDSQYVGPNG